MVLVIFKERVSQRLSKRNLLEQGFLKMVILTNCTFTYRDDRTAYCECNGDIPPCPCCGGVLHYRDMVPRIVRKYGGETSYILISRFRCSNEDCTAKIHRGIPSQLTPHKHFLTEVIEDAVDDIIQVNDAVCPDDISSPSEQTIAKWKTWIEFNKKLINEILTQMASFLLSYGVASPDSQHTWLDTLRADGAGWLRTVLCLTYNFGCRMRSAYLCS